MGIRRYTVTDFRTEFPNDDACLDRIFELRYSNLVCPKCESDNKFKKVKNRRSYQCPSCGFQIYPTQGTVFEKTTTPLNFWFYAIFLQTTTRNGVAARELERQLNICYKTALRMSHQIKLLMANKKSNPFTGVLMADESFIGGLNKNRHADKKIADSQGRSVKDKIPVFGIMKKGGKQIHVEVVEDTKGTTLKPIIDAKVDKDASIMITDEWLGYSKLKNEYAHVVVNHLSGEYARGAFDNNGIENFWSHLKRTIKGTHIAVSKKHLQKYIDEVAFRYVNRDRQDEMFDLILKNVV